MTNPEIKTWDNFVQSSRYALENSMGYWEDETIVNADDELKSLRQEVVKLENILAKVYRATRKSYLENVLEAVEKELKQNGIDIEFVHKIEKKNK